MKGFIPEIESNIELNTKHSQSFIELGVSYEEHDENCDCEKCTSSLKEVN